MSRRKGNVLGHFTIKGIKFTVTRDDVNQSGEISYRNKNGLYSAGCIYRFVGFDQYEDPRSGKIYKDTKVRHEIGGDPVKDAKAYVQKYYLPYYDILA